MRVAVESLQVAPIPHDIELWDVVDGCPSRSSGSDASKSHFNKTSPFLPTKCHSKPSRFWFFGRCSWPGGSERPCSTCGSPSQACPMPGRARMTGTSGAVQSLSPTRRRGFVESSRLQGGGEAFLRCLESTPTKGGFVSRYWNELANVVWVLILRASQLVGYRSCTHDAWDGQETPCHPTPQIFQAHKNRISLSVFILWLFQIVWMCIRIWRAVGLL